ncbi:MAG: hypothetical protein P8O73_09610 [SAR324 cluster bacterium]|nr:hypothetical protein [SAR324 cluster bacterium]
MKSHQRTSSIPPATAGPAPAPAIVTGLSSFSRFVSFAPFRLPCSGKNWRKLRGFDYLAKVFEGVQFSDGIEVNPEIRIAA